MLTGITDWISQWGPQLQILGGIILGLAAIVLGTRSGAKSAVSGGSGGSNTRETFSSLLGLLIGALIVGAALIVVPMLIEAGSSSGNVPPPAGAEAV